VGGSFSNGCFLAAARELMQSRQRRDKNIKIAHNPAKLIVRGEFFAPKVFIRTFG